MNCSRRNGLALLLGALFLPLSAAALDTVFMLQLGSFPSQEEAEGQWGDIQSKHSGVLGDLNAQVRSVQLPPDDLVVFRTQAGPVRDRSQAEDICAKIGGAGDECFVVETAMVDLPELPTAQHDITAPTPSFSAPAFAAATPTLDTPALTAPDLAAAAAPIVTDAPAFLQEREAAEALLRQNVTGATAPTIATPTIAAPTIEAPAFATPSASDIIPEQQDNVFSELFEGDNSLPNIQRDTSIASPAAPAGLPPLSEAQLARIPPPPAGFNAPAPERFESPVEVVTPSIRTPEVTVPADIAPAAPTLAELAPATIAAPQVTINEPRIAAPADPLSNIDLPVPPRITLEDGRQIAAPVVVNEAPQVLSLDASLPGGRVEVDEAIPVPLSQQASPFSRPAAPAPTTPAYNAQAAAKRGLPSQSLQQKTFWAQISRFETQQNALNYWDQFRSANPRFPAVRVRVTQPYVRSNASDKPIALRVGPFNGPGMVGALCKNLPAAGVTCSAVTDLGTSAAANQPRNRASAGRYDSRLSGANGRPGLQGFWVQLGAHDTPAQAEHAWEDLQRQHSPLLGKLRSNIATPPLSSSARTKFRLRTGPYVRVASATELCGQLKQRGVRCLVVSGR